MTEKPISLIFHGIGKPGRELEPGEAPYWIGTERFEAILDRIATTPERFILTFDDGNASDHQIALPRLAARGLNARFFLLSGRLNMPGSLDVQQIRSLASAGMMIGSHGVGHRDWTTLDTAAMKSELDASRTALEAACEHPVTEAGIPFGSYNARVLRAIRAVGYRCAWSSDRGRTDPAAFLRPRTSIRGDMTAAELDAVLAGRLSPARQIRRYLGMTRRRFLPLT